MLVPRRMGGRRPAFGAGAEGADVRPQRCGGGGAHDLAARAGRRDTELGLPVHVDPRLHADADLAVCPGIHGGGGRVQAVARTDRGRTAGGPPDRVRDRGRAAPARARAAAPGGASRVEAGPDWQRGREAAPAGLLRPDPRGRVAVREVRGRAHRGELAVPVWPHRHRVRAVAPARSGDLGDPRSATALRSLEAELLGGAGPGRPDRRAVRPSGPHRPVVARAGGSPRPWTRRWPTPRPCWWPRRG